MAREKIVVAELYSTDTEVGDLRVPVAGTSGGATRPNPMVGDRLWNSVAAVVEVAVVGGSWTVEIQGTVAGLTGLPFARNATIGAPDGLAGTFPLTNLTNSAAMPTPTHVLFDETAAGGLTATVHVMAKTYRGSLSSGPSNSFRVVEGILYNSGAISADTTIDLSTNPPAGGTFGSFMGLDKYNLWDSCCFFVEGRTVTGTWDVDIVGLVGGNTVTIARTGTGGTIAGVTKMALQNLFNGPTPKPSQIIFTETGAGTGTFVVAAIAKAHRGQRHKI